MKPSALCMPLLAALVLAAMAAPATATGDWRQAFGSSPSAYQAISPQALEQAAKQWKIAPEILAQMNRKTAATGTLRFRATLTAGGTAVRVRLSNEAGTAPLVVSGASVGLAGKGFEAVPGQLKALTFGGAPSIAIPAGAPVLSDPVPLAVAAGGDLVVSVYLKGTLEFDARGNALVAEAAGDQTLVAAFPEHKEFPGRPLVTGIDVLSSHPPHVIAVLGDSLSDGNRPILGVLQSWPQALARRLIARKSGGRYAVVNAAIAGNQLLLTAAGDAGLARLDRDVLRIEGLTHLILLEGENDIGMSGHSMIGDGPPLTADDLIAGYRQVIARAHARGVKVIVGTMLPFGGGVTHYTPERDKVREAANEWIRTSHEPDAVLDFDKLIRDPATPSKMRADYDSGDHLHPGETGFRAMADLIDLSLFP